MVKIGITMGDPSGIGPEITLKALQHFDCKEHEFTLYGDFKVYEQIRGIMGLPVNTLMNVNIKDMNFNPRPIEFGKIDKEYGRSAGEYIQKAIYEAVDETIDAVVTAPIHKESFKLGGYGELYPGHTEMFAKLTHTENYSMMLAHGKLRVLHLTTHIPFKDIANYVTAENVYNKLCIARDTCKQLGLEGHIGVAGLNPHMGEHGLFGNEEAQIEEAIKKGNFNAKLEPADVIFSKAIAGVYDIVLAMYHDQGHIPAKMAGFKHNGTKWTEMKGVNVTLGLPIIRTSVDHGVAFGKAGKGIADESSMVDAIEYAIKLAMYKKST